MAIHWYGNPNNVIEPRGNRLAESADIHIITDYIFRNQYFTSDYVFESTIIVSSDIESLCYEQMRT